MLLASQLRDARKALGASQSDLAGIAGVRRARISEVENGGALLPGEEEKLLAGLVALRSDQARSLVAPIIRKGTFMDSNEIENLQAKQKHCEERIASLQGTLVLIAAREAKARDGISLLADRR